LRGHPDNNNISKTGIFYDGISILWKTQVFHKTVLKKTYVFLRIIGGLSKHKLILFQNIVRSFLETIEDGSKTGIL